MANNINDKKSTHKQVGNGLKAAMELRLIDRKMKTIDQWWPRFTMLNPEITLKEVVKSLGKRREELIQEKTQWRTSLQLKKMKPRPLYDPEAIRRVYPNLPYSSRYATLTPDIVDLFRQRAFENQTHFDVAHPTKFIRDFWNIPEHASGDVWFWPSMESPEVHSDNADDNGLKFSGYLNPFPDLPPARTCSVAALGALEIAFPAYETRESRIHYWTQIVVGIPNGVEISEGYYGHGDINIVPMGYEDTSGDGIQHSAETGDTAQTVINDFYLYPGALNICESTDDYITIAFDIYDIVVAHKGMSTRVYLGISVYLHSEDADIDLQGGYFYLRVPDWASDFGPYGVYYRRDPWD